MGWGSEEKGASLMEQTYSIRQRPRDGGPERYVVRDEITVELGRLDGGGVLGQRKKLS